MTKDAKTIEFRKCGCGCNADVAGQTQFKQGHDARMVSQLVRLVTGAGNAAPTAPAAFTKAQIEDATAGSMDIQESINRTVKAVEDYHGAKLADKTMTALMNGWVKAVRSSTPRASKKAIEVVTAKVGRWTREGFVNAKGEFKYQDKAKQTVTVAKGKYTLV